MKTFKITVFVLFIAILFFGLGSGYSYNKYEYHLNLENEDFVKIYSTETGIMYYVPLAEIQETIETDNL